MRELTKPKPRIGGNFTKVVVDGKLFDQVKDAVKYFGISHEVLTRWVKEGKAIKVEEVA